jgi:hypothetical protein
MLPTRLIRALAASLLIYHLSWDRGARAMIKLMSVSALFISFLLVISCRSTSRSTGTSLPAAPPGDARVEPEVAAYGFVHHETTGLTARVIINGQERPIQFRPDSEPVALAALRALKWQVLLPNANGQKLFLIGQYFAEPKRTPSCERCPEAEEYHEFKLVDWYLTTPFKATREDCEDCPYLLEENLRERGRLEQTDFADFSGREKIEVGRFQRKAGGQ